MELRVFLDEKVVYLRVFGLQERQPGGGLCFFFSPSSCIAAVFFSFFFPTCIQRLCLYR
jgi:hypothetical protein